MLNIIRLYTCCCPCLSSGTNSIISINARDYKIEKLLQDENLSYSYLVRTLDSEPPFENGPLFVLKRIYCPFGDIESVSAAMNEISYYKKFAGNSHIISCLDYQLHQKYDGSKQIDVLFPFYHYGSVQDDINRHLLSSSTALGTVIPEKDCIKIMIGLCRGLLPLHDPKLREQGLSLIHI